jgi:DNA invertase Pin-like site-specific DNA recombinase
MSDKIKAQHVGRKAILYVRQSSPYQVVNNTESKRLQYAMRLRLEEAGWTEIEVIDEDLGQSAAGATTRNGFERLVAEVCMGEVGAVAARELSRFARNSREWQRLIEVCRVVDTVLIDHEQVYSPRISNDRLLLGLKGSLNEYELDLLRQRSLEARYEKARRGELVIAACIGFLKTPDQRIEKDPDRRVQERIELVFKKFFELGSVRQTMLWFIEHAIKLPKRNARGELSWRTPRGSTILNILRNPCYAGAYAFGKTEHGNRYENGQAKKHSRRKPRDQWISFIKDHHEGYITWQDFERIESMIAENNHGIQAKGAVRRGPALLAGLFRCRRCGRKLTVAYSGGGNNRFVRYSCLRGNMDTGEPRCIAFGGVPVDAAVSRELLRALQPTALEASIMAKEQFVQQADAMGAALRRDLQAAQYEAARAQKQFDAADPENRLVTDELERRWNQALSEVEDLKVRIAEYESNVPIQSDVRLDDFASLADDIEEIWNSSDSSERIKKRIIRALVREIIVDLDEPAGKINLVIHWQGGVHTELSVPRRKRGKATCTSADAIEAVRSLSQVCTDQHIAGVLNRNGLRTGRGNRFTKERVTSLRNYHGITIFCPEKKQENGWMTLNEAADYLGVSARTLRLAVEAGKVSGSHPLPDGPWVFNQSDLDTDEARSVRDRSRSHNRRGAAVPNAGQQNLDFPDL